MVNLQQGNRRQLTYYEKDQELNKSVGVTFNGPKGLAEKIEKESKEYYSQ